MFEKYEITNWWWVRHAPVPKTVNNGNFYGSRDVDCDISEKKYFEFLYNQLPTSDNVFITSTLKRTHQTLNAIYNKNIDFEQYNELNEQCFGDWEDTSYDEMEKNNDQEYLNFWHAPARSIPPNGESYAQLTMRSIPVINQINKKHCGKNIICVSHGGIIRSAIMNALELECEKSLNIQIDNLSITKIQSFVKKDDTNHDDITWKINFINHKYYGKFL